MFKVFQDFYFTVGSLRDGYLLKYIGDFLYGEFLFCLLVNCGTHHPISPAADVFNCFIVCVF